MPNSHTTQRPSAQHGFTLVEALVAMFILSFGIVAVSNLSIVSMGSNQTANQSTAAAMLAARQMEVLQATPYSNLVDSPIDSYLTDQAGFFRDDVITGVGTFRTRWQIASAGTSPPMKYLRVRSEARGLLGSRARTEFTALRSCTTAVGTPGVSCPA